MGGEAGRADMASAECARADNFSQGRDYAHVSRAIANLRGVFILILIGFHSCLPYLASTRAPNAAFDAPPFFLARLSHRRLAPVLRL